MSPIAWKNFGSPKKAKQHLEEMLHRAKGVKLPLAELDHEFLEALDTKISGLEAVSALCTVLVNAHPTPSVVDLGFAFRALASRELDKVYGSKAIKQRVSRCAVEDAPSVLAFKVTILNRCTKLSKKAIRYQTMIGSLERSFVDNVTNAKPSLHSGQVLATRADYEGFLEQPHTSNMLKQACASFRNIAADTNRPVLSALLALRQNLAVELGFEDYASMQLSDCLLSSKGEVLQMLGSLAKGVQASAGEAYAGLIELAQTKGLIPADAREIPDYLKFRVGRVEADRSSNGLARVKFTEKSVRSAAFSSAERLFGVSIKPIKTPAWAKEVRTYRVTSSQGARIIGTLHLDLLPRVGKVPHPMCEVVCPGKVGAEEPEVAVLCNFPRGPGGTPACTIDDALMLFHELGHAFEFLLAGNQRFGVLSGGSQEPDFIEVPAMIFERVLWECVPEFKPIRKLGSEWVAQIKELKREGFAPLDLEQQLYYAEMCLNLHDSGNSLTHGEIAQAAQEKHTRFPRGIGTSPHCSFSHIVWYGATYYSYLLADKIAERFWEIASSGDQAHKAAWFDKLKTSVFIPGGKLSAKEKLSALFGKSFSAKVLVKA